MADCFNCRLGEVNGPEQTSKSAELGINPKDELGLKKVPLGSVSPFAIAHEACAMLDGELKYGYRNWRGSKVLARVYANAAKRHIDDWLEGIESSSDAKVHSLGHARACLGILIDAEETGNLVDDRLHKAPQAYERMMSRLNAWVKERVEKYATEEAAKRAEGSDT